MSAISSNAALLNTQQSTSESNASRFNELTSEDFVKIIVTELTRQDPLKPNDTNALLGQISSIRQIESDQSLAENIKTLVRSNEFASASGLIGSQVTGITDDNQRVAGIVISVSQTRDGPVATLASGTRLRFSQIDEVSLPEIPSDDDDDGDDDGDGGTVDPPPTPSSPSNLGPNQEPGVIRPSNGKPNDGTSTDLPTPASSPASASGR
jgi:flagellar basal-body rod modification protein FlgD